MLNNAQSLMHVSVMSQSLSWYPAEVPIVQQLISKIKIKYSRDTGYHKSQTLILVRLLQLDKEEQNHI